MLAILDRLDEIDSQFDDAYAPIYDLVSEFDFGTYQNWLLRRELQRICKRDAYRACMNVLLNNKPLKYGFNGTSRSQIVGVVKRK